MSRHCLGRSLTLNRSNNFSTICSDCFSFALVNVAIWYLWYEWEQELHDELKVHFRHTRLCMRQVADNVRQVVVDGIVLCRQFAEEELCKITYCLFRVNQTLARSDIWPLILTIPLRMRWVSTMSVYFLTFGDGSCRDEKCLSQEESWMRLSMVWCCFEWSQQERVWCVEDVLFTNRKDRLSKVILSSPSDLVEFII